MNELIVCSLEAWDEVWRRNQFLVDGLLRRDLSLRVLFVEPPSDLVHGALHARVPRDPRLRVRGYDGRLSSVSPWKLLPRRVGPWSDRALLAQVRRAVRALDFRAPLLWINDLTYAPLAGEEPWPCVYDVTDDWLLAGAHERERERLRTLEQQLLRVADEVVVCSPMLAASRGKTRRITLVPNGVDVELFAAGYARPLDLPPRRVAVYVGTLHEDRLDVELVVELAQSLPQLQVVLVGPDSLSPASRRRLASCPNVHLLGARPYHDVPAYLQHADVIVVPHVVTPFTESLDPIKAYEVLAVGTPTVATRVAGFRDLGPPVLASARDDFVAAVERTLAGAGARAVRSASDDVSWDARVVAFAAVLERAAHRQQRAA